MNYMFEKLRKLTSLDLGAFKTSNAQEMKGMFSNCIALQTLDLSSFDTANVTNMYQMFNSCSKLITIVVGSGWNTDKVTSSLSMFSNCARLVGGKGTKMSDVGNIGDKTYAKVDGGVDDRGYLTAAHQHGFTYQANGATITATCTAEGNCTLPEKTATLTIVAPTLTTEGETGTGISAEATITDENNIRGDATVSYYSANAEGTDKTGDALSGVPTTAGKYWAEITLGTGDDAATAHVVYTIAAATTLVTKVELNKTSIQLAVGGTETLTPSFTPANANDQTVTWSIDPSGVATVSEEGVVTGVAVGTATITVTATNGTGDTNDDVTATCGVTVGNYVAEVVSGEKHETLQAAITAAQAGDTVKLLADIVTSNTIYIKKNLTLDLNGYGIIGKNVSGRAVVEIAGTDSSNSAIVNLNDSNTSRTGGDSRPTGVTGGYITGGSAGGLSTNANSMLTMNGGTITGNSTSVLGGGGVSNSGVFTMNGGAITNNRSASRGGGVSNSGTFTMNAGAITGNTAGTNGGGVYYSGGKLNINGGTITGNSAGSLGGGVYVSGANFKLSGGPVIKDNKVGTGTANSNVYLDKWVSGSNSSQRIITISASLSNTDAIGIAMDTPGVFTKDLKKYGGTAANFTSDSSDYSVTLNSSGDAQLVGHVHNFTYALATVTTANDSITATCGNTGSTPACDLTGGKVTLTLTPTTKTAPESAPSGTIVIVNPADYQATLTGLTDFNDATALGIQQSDVKYYNTQDGAKTGEVLSQTPYNAGTYCAEITVDGVTASVIYTINPPTYEGQPTAVFADVTDTTVRIKTPVQSGETYEYKLGDGAWTTTPTFKGLNPHTQYAISARMKEHPDDTVVTGTATTYYTTAITGTAKVGNTLTASVTDLTPESDYDFKWFVGQTDTPSYGKTYTIQAADVGKQAKLVVVRKATSSVVGEALSDPIAAKDTLAAADFTYTAPEGTTNGLVEYDGSTKAATVTSTKQGVGEITVEYWLGTDEAYSTTTVPTVPGTYTVKISIPETDNYSKVEHFTAEGWTFTITKGTQTITAEDVTVTYGDTDKKVSASVATPETGGGALSYAVKDGSADYIEVASDGTLTIKKVPADGTAYVTVTAAETATYAKATIDVTVTINKANAVPATVTAKTLTYNGQAQELVTAGTATGGEMQYALGTENAATEEYTTSIPKGTDVGTYYVWYKVVGDANHNDTNAASITATISRRSSGGSSSSNTSTTTITVPVTGDTGSTAVSASVKGTEATVTAMTEKQLDDIVGMSNESNNQNCTIEIDVSSLGKDIKTATIPTETVKVVEKAANDATNDATGLTVKLSDGSITLDAQALTAVTEQAKGNTIQLNLDGISTSSMTSAQRETVQTMDVQAVYDAYMTSNGSRISNFHGGKATVSVPYTLKEGQNRNGVLVWYIADNGDKVEMPTSYDGKEVSFTTTHFSNYVVVYDAERAAICPQDATCPISKFVDADASAWYHDGVHWALDKGVMNGVSPKYFNPNGDTSRAMVVTMLWRMEGSPAYVGMSEFTDVENTDWYGQAVRWASAEGIVEGYTQSGNKVFNPNGAVTREQLAAILYRYAQYKKQDVSVGEDTNILSYDDAFSVSTWAMAAMQWAVGSGAVSGRTNTTLNPKNTATRAEIATIIMRYCTEIAK